MPGAARLDAREVLRTAFGVYRARPGRVAGTAAIVFGVTAAIGTLLELEIVQETDVDEVKVAVRLATAAIWAFGVVFYAGLLDLVVGAYLQGRPDPSIGEIVERLPLARLFGADVVLALGTGVGLLLLVVPGVVFFTLCSLVGPIIVTEGQSLRRAFARSQRLVRPHFWFVLLLVTVPVAVEDQVMHLLDPRLYDHPLLASFVVTALLGVAIGSIVGLVEVTIAHELRHRHPLEVEAPTS